MEDELIDIWGELPWSDQITLLCLDGKLNAFYFMDAWKKLKSFFALSWETITA